MHILWWALLAIAQDDAPSSDIPEAPTAAPAALPPVPVPPLPPDAEEPDPPATAMRGPREVKVPARWYPRDPDVCQVWYPGWDAEDQPEAAPCSRVSRPLRGRKAYLLYRSRAWDLTFDWAEWADAHPDEDIPTVVREISAGRGEP